MTREIEFRAWLKNDKVMTGKVLQITDNPSVQYIKFDKIENWKGNQLNNPTFADLRDVVLMQYTGLKDKNGSKIFESDIVEIKRVKIKRNKNKNTFIDKVIYNNELCGFRFEGLADDYLDFYDWLNEGAELRVIGNIYENPELLGVEND